MQGSKGDLGEEKKNDFYTLLYTFGILFAAFNFICKSDQIKVINI